MFKCVSKLWVFFKTCAALGNNLTIKPIEVIKAMNNNNRIINNTIGRVIAAFLIFLSSGISLAEPVLPTVKVYKSPTCGCCKKWISHLESNGFKVEATNLNNLTPIKDKLGIEPRIRSCHTAKIGGYVVEGHVPASDIKRMLKDKPEIVGLAVPGMPMGSPGMEGPRKDNYSVIAIGKSGELALYNRH